MLRNRGFRSNSDSSSTTRPHESAKLAIRLVSCELVVDVYKRYLRAFSLEERIILAIRFVSAMVPLANNSA